MKLKKSNRLSCIDIGEELALLLLLYEFREDIQRNLHSIDCYLLPSGCKILVPGGIKNKCLTNVNCIFGG